jgi:hypothetical protein
LIDCKRRKQHVRKEKGTMKKTMSVCIAAMMAILFTCSSAYSWGTATHAFGADRSGKKLPGMNLNEIYGVMAADLFNYSFDLAANPVLYQYLRAHTHGFPGMESFLKVWGESRVWGYERNSAFGYVFHNDVWGMDYTAHWQAQTIPKPAGFPDRLPPGYVIIKAWQLNQILTSHIPEYAALGLPEDLGVEVCHNLVEAAGDILIAREDDAIGGKILAASLVRSPSFPNLLVRVMGEEHKDLVVKTEKEFRKIAALLGGSLLMGEENAIQALTEQLAELGAEYLKLYGIQLDAATIKPLVEVGIRQAMLICEADYLNEVRATIRLVEGNLAARGIRY